MPDIRHMHWLVTRLYSPALYGNWNGGLHRELLKLENLYLSIEVVGLCMENSRLGIYHINPKFIL